MTDQPARGRGTTTAPTLGSPQKCFTARYRRRENVTVNELEEYFKLLPEDFEKCDPIKWWVGRRAQFPNLFRLARDILCIPGSAVAVERIFSGGRDTISPRRASLHPETIRVGIMRSCTAVQRRITTARREKTRMDIWYLSDIRFSISKIVPTLV